MKHQTFGVWLSQKAPCRGIGNDHFPFGAEFDQGHGNRFKLSQRWNNVIVRTGRQQVNLALVLGPCQF